MKNEKYNKSLTTELQNSLLLFLVYGKGYIFTESIVWEIVVYTITHLVKFFLVLPGI